MQLVHTSPHKYGRASSSTWSKQEQAAPSGFDRPQRYFEMIRLLLGRTPELYIAKERLENASSRASVLPHYGIRVRVLRQNPGRLIGSLRQDSAMQPSRSAGTPEFTLLVADS